MISNLRAQLNSTFKTVTFRQSTITFSATVLNGAMGALFYIITARFLGPSDFGLMVVAITTLTLVGDIGDLGVNTAIVRFVGMFARNDPENAAKYLKLGLTIKLSVIAFVALFGILASNFIANTIFSKPEMLLPLRLAFLGVSSYLLFSFVVSSLQSFQKFTHWSALLIGTNLFRLLLVASTLAIGVLSLKITLAIYIFIPLIGFLVGLKFIPIRFLNAKNDQKILNNFFRYSKWVALFSVVAAIGARLDTFISAKLLTTQEVGIYSAANQLVQIVPQIVTAIATVVAPKMTTMGSLKELIKYMKKIQVMVIGISLVGVLCIPVVVYAIPLIYGTAYVNAVPVFIVLLLAMLVFLIAVPVHNAIFYYFAYPKLFFFISVLHALLVCLLGWYLIGSYGVIGAAVTVLVGQLISFAIPLVWVLKKIYSNNQ
jgi:O-antigen/teichoic acid export membrane protein